MKSIFFTGTLISIFLSIASTATAGIIKSTTNTNLTQRSCPAVNADFIEYKAKWGEVILEYFANNLPGSPQTVDEITPEAACIFNTQWEQYFEDAEPGSKVSLENIQNNVDNAYLESADDAVWLQALLDNTALSLPEAHFVVTSQESERNSANLFSAQSFLWEGETTVLEFSAFFDFSKSTGTWGTSLDSYYGLSIGANQDMVLGASLFPDSWGNELSATSYNSSNDLGITNEDINYRDITISFTVNNGDKFQLWALSQAFGLNGGWVDSANTMKTQLAIEGLSLEESNTIFSNALTVDIPEPSTIAIFGLALIGLASRRFKKQA